MELRARHVRERRVLLLQPLDLGELIERRRIGAVEAERDRRVEDLLHGRGAEAELVGAPHLRRRARRGITSPVSWWRANRASVVVAPRPLLEHLRRRLDEVPLGRDAALRDPALVAAEHVVHEVAELVEHRDDVVVLHQRAAARPTGRGKLHTSTPSGSCTPRDAVLERELRRVLVLALARMHVEVDPAELRRRRARRRRREHVGVPDAGVVGRPATYARSKISDVISSRPASTRVVREVLAHLARVDLVALLLDEVLEPRPSASRRPRSPPDRRCCSWRSSSA